MHDVSNAINILDSTKGVDKAICKNGFKHAGDGQSAEAAEEAGKCGGVKHSARDDKFNQLSHMFEKPSGGTGTPWYAENGEKDKRMHMHTSTTISKDVSELTRDQKGVVSSAFAKALPIRQPTP